MRKMQKWKKEFPWKKKFPRIFAVVLAAVMLFTMPGTASMAVAETVETETSVVQELETGDSDPNETETGDEDTEDDEQGEQDADNALMLADGHDTKQTDDEASVTISGNITYYSTLEEAFTAANGKTATITMLKDAECVSTDSANPAPLAVSGGTVTLDMNGKTLSGGGYGYYGIINVSRGSLTVQGNGIIKVQQEWIGLSCYGGTLTVTEVQFQLITSAYAPMAAILNRNGTIIINSSTIRGMADIGQVCHWQGNTIINDVTATGTTGSFPKGVCYYEKGSLKINGGSFSNITIEEGTSVSSVKELLGDGVTYKHQGGTWAAEDELAAMSIENVTVEKVPLTIKPSAETSWYYGSGEHSLTMNAQPVAGGTVAYEWFDGDTKLECADDVYTIPADMAAKTYTYTCKATCDGYTLSRDFTFEIKKSGTEFTGDGVAKAYLMDKEQYTFSVDDSMITVIATPTVTGSASANAAMAASFTESAGGQMALFVGNTQVSAPGDAGYNGSYTMNAYTQDVLAAAGEPGTIELIARFVGNDNQAGAETSVEVTITAAVKVTTSSETYYYSTIEDAWEYAKNNSPATVTLLSDAEAVKMLTTTSATPIILDAGAYTLTLSSSGLSFGGSVRLRGGTFRSSDSITLSGETVINLLDNSDGIYRAFYKDGQPIPLEANQNSLPAGTYTVKECRHDAAGVKQYQHNDDTETHTLTCLACGYTEAENCSYSFSGNVGTCPDCQDALTVSVTGMDSLTYDGNEKKPEVTVMRDGTALDATKYTVAYNGNKDAGTNMASVTVTIGSSQGTYTETFSIGRAPLTITASDQTITYGQNIRQGVTQANVSGLCGSDMLSGVTITPSSNQVTVENKTVVPSAAIIMDGSDQDVTANYDITYVPGKLTIDRAEGTLTVSENTISKTFGDGEFSLNCSTNGDGKITYISSNKDVATVSADGNVLITGVGETVITATLAEGTNHTGGARQEITVTVEKASAPAIAGETRNYTYTNGSNGAVTMDVAGRLPKDRGETKYTFTIADGKGILSEVSVDGNGNLVYTVLGNGAEGDTASITVRAEMANYETAAFTVDIVLVEKWTVEPQAGSSVSISGSNTLIYGQMLSDLTLSNVTFVEQGTDKKVEGTLAWKNSSLTPAAGTTGGEWVFTPTNSSEYAEMTGTVPITVAKATPDADTPAAGAVTYDPSGKLSSVTLTGGNAAWTVGGSMVNVEGTWNWKDGSISPAAGNRGYMAVFTPKDTGNYNTVEREITVTVGRAEPYIEGKVSAAPISYGDSLNASALTGTAQYSSLDGTVVPGSFTWKDGTVKPAVSDSGSTKYAVIFTPDEGTNYSSVETEITLVVEKAENAPNMPSGTMNVPRRCEKVGDVELPSGWQWREADREKELEIDVPLYATAIYVGADKDNYEKTEVTITIARSNCDHEKTELKDVIPATCEKEGYSGDTWCTICGELLQKGSATPTIDHKGGVASCREQAVCEMCRKPYGPYDANHHISTERRNATPASCTAAGNTGDLYCTACGAKVESGKVIPASGHSYYSQMTKAPTVSEEGVMTYSCTRCGHSYTAAISRLETPAPGQSPGMGTGNTENPEDGTGTAQEGRPDAGIPFIKDADGKIGWDVIRAEEEKAQDGNVINVDMNGSTVVPGNIFDSIKDRDITVTFDMGNGILWSVYGKNITRDASRDKAGDIDFSVRTGVSTVPVDIVNTVTGESYSIQISLAYEGEFGFTAVLSINLGKENAGYTASLYYYNENIGELEFICSDIVAEDGTAELAFTHASDYVIAIDGGEESGGITETAKMEDHGGTEDNVPPESSRTVQGRKNVLWPVVAGILALAGIVFAGMFVWKKKKEKDSGKERDK